MKDGKLVSLDIDSMGDIMDLCGFEHLDPDIIMNEKNFEKVFKRVLRRHESVSLLEDKGIDEVSRALIEGIRESFKDCEK